MIYVGTYYSDELKVTYQVFTEDKKLFLSFPNNPKIELALGQKNEFGSGNRTRYLFKSNENQKLTGLL